MIINPTPAAQALGYSQLVELYGDPLGFSIGKTLRKTGSALKKAGGVVKRNAGNIAVAATALPTGGLSLLAKKNVRKGVGNTASFAVRKIAAPIARSAIVQKAAGQYIRNFVPGGSAAMNTLSSLQKKKPKPAAPVTTSTASAFMDRARAATRNLVAPVEAAAPFPVLPVALGVGGVALLAVLMMSRKGKAAK